MIEPEKKCPYCGHPITKAHTSRIIDRAWNPITRKTYVRTKKRLPGVIEPAPEPVVAGSEFAPRRHWMDAALFGEYGRAIS